MTAGAVAALFATTGPLALILTVGRESGLAPDQISGWVFAGYSVGGLLSVLFSSFYRQPIGLAWSIPGTAMLLTALQHRTFEEAVGAYLVCGLIMTFLGLTGWISRLTALVPMSVVMGMIAGVFLPFGIGIITGFTLSPLIAAVMVGGFVVTAVLPPRARIIPPILVALICGVVGTLATSAMSGWVPAGDWIASPELRGITFSPLGLAEMVPPMLLSVLAVQNLQGYAVLGQAGHTPPINALTVACGYGSLAMGALGSVPTCVTGPVNGILVTARPPERRWAGGVVFGLLMILFGVFAPLTTALATGLPPVFIMVLGGLAMLPVLGDALYDAFKAPARLGALTAFLVTVSDIHLFNVGAPLWGLVAGILVTVLLERPRRPVAPGSRPR